MARTLDRTIVGGDTPLAPLLTTLPAMARVVVVSDLLGDCDALLRVAAQRAAAGGILECVHVVAVEELQLQTGTHLARDPDVPTVARPVDGRAQAEYRARFDEFRADCRRRWRATGAGYVEARTDVSVSRLVRQIATGSGRGSDAGVDARDAITGGRP